MSCNNLHPAVKMRKNYRHKITRGTEKLSTQTFKRPVRGLELLMRQEDVEADFISVIRWNVHSVRQRDVVCVCVCVLHEGHHWHIKGGVQAQMNTVNTGGETADVGLNVYALN